MVKKALVTGSCGLIGSEVSIHLARNGYRIYGVDNNERAVFFGPEGDTSWSLERLRREIPGYEHNAIDTRNRRSCTCPPTKSMATCPTRFDFANWTRAGTTTTRNTNTASPRRFPSTSPSILYSALLKWPRTSWSRNMAV